MPPPGPPWAYPSSSRSPAWLSTSSGTCLYLVTYLFPQECSSSILFQRTAPLGASTQNDDLGCSSTHQRIRGCLGAPVLPLAGWAVLVEFLCDSIYELQVLLCVEPNTRTRALHTMQTHTPDTHMQTQMPTHHTLHTNHAHTADAHRHTDACRHIRHTYHRHRTNMPDTSHTQTHHTCKHICDTHYTHITQSHTHITPAAQAYCTRKHVSQTPHAHHLNTHTTPPPTQTHTDPHTPSSRSSALILRGGTPKSIRRKRVLCRLPDCSQSQGCAEVFSFSPSGNLSRLLGMRMRLSSEASTS